MIDQDLKKLEELVKNMEASDLPLEKSLELFSQGVDLVKKCHETLEKADLRVKEILNGAISPNS